jgi:IS1 family transposase
VLPHKRHVIGKSHTVAIEQNNSNTRHHLGRFTRRTKVVSKKAEMVDLTLKLWHALTTEETFTSFQKTALHIFR